jgi:hypothetical protein
VGSSIFSGQNSLREARSIDLVRCVHTILAKGSSRILNQGDVVGKLTLEKAVASSRFLD